jgi:hypothetical protein
MSKLRIRADGRDTLAILLTLQATAQFGGVRSLDSGRLHFVCNIIRDDEIYENMSSVKFAFLLDANART